MLLALGGEPPSLDDRVKGRSRLMSGVPHQQLVETTSLCVTFRLAPELDEASCREKEGEGGLAPKGREHGRARDSP